MQVLFWLNALLIGYIYLGYPLLLRCLPKRPITWEDDQSSQPLVTVLIPAFNEAAVIESTIRNKLAQNYPSDKLEIIVISDESEDGTDDIVKQLSEEDARIRLIRQTPRQGKTAGLNKAVAKAKGDIIVFSDANSHYEQNAISALVNCFNDPEVGYVTGKMVYVNEEGNLVGDGCSAYMRYENNLRALETQVSERRCHPQRALPGNEPRSASRFCSTAESGQSGAAGGLLRRCASAGRIPDRLGFRVSRVSRVLGHV